MSDCAVQISGSFCSLLRCLLRFVDVVSRMLSELAGEVQLQLRIVNTGEGRWRLIGIVEPSEKIAVNKELLA